MMQGHAVVVVDTPDSIILRARTALAFREMELREALILPPTRSFQPRPPSLSHTTLKSASLCGKRIKKAETSRNSLVIAASALR